MKNRIWHAGIEEDSLEAFAAEVGELENDELSAGEAGFMQGYEEAEEYE